MDEKKSNIRLVRTGGRKVTKATTEYDDFMSDRNSAYNRRKEQPVKKRGVSELERKVRYQKQQKEKRLKMQRRRALAVFVLIVVLVLVLLFMTPIFNIRSVSVEGNRLVTAEQFQEKLKPLVGENLLRTGGGKIRKNLKAIPYIDKVDVQKKMFPPSVNIVITEYTPTAVLRTEGTNLIVNSQLRVLSDSGEMIEPVPTVTGFTVSGYKVGDVIKTDDNEKKQILITALSTIEAVGLVDKFIEINLNDITDITMNYDDRMTVKCGTQLDLERKLRLFRETVVSNSLADNAQGTMDLSETGKAVYTP